MVRTTWLGRRAADGKAEPVMAHFDLLKCLGGQCVHSDCLPAEARRSLSKSFPRPICLALRRTPNHDAMIGFPVLENVSIFLTHDSGPGLLHEHVTHDVESSTTRKTSDICGDIVLKPDRGTAFQTAP